MKPVFEKLEMNLVCIFGFNLIELLIKNNISRSVPDIPINGVKKSHYLEKLRQEIYRLGNQSPNIPVVVLCHRGNDSQKAVIDLRKQIEDLPQVTIRDLVGGLSAWAQTIDSTFPEY